MFRISIAGIQNAQSALLRAYRATSPVGGLGRAVTAMLAAAHRYAVIVTHVDTGALRSSHLVVRETLTSGVIYLNPAARNPVSLVPVKVYGPIEHARGGAHAFYERVKREAEPSIQAIGWATIRGGF